MSRFIKKRALSRKAKLGVGAVVLTAAAASTSIALAYPQDGGGPNGGQLTISQCGPNQSSTVVTQSAASVYSNVAPALLPGAIRAFNAPAGKCVKLLFTAETACNQPGGTGFCYVQAFLDGQPMNPNGAGFQAIDSNDATASGHAFEWVGRTVEDGNHVVTLTVDVDAATTNFYIDDWTFDLQLFA